MVQTDQTQASFEACVPGQTQATWGSGQQWAMGDEGQPNESNLAATLW